MNESENPQQELKQSPDPWRIWAEMIKTVFIVIILTAIFRIFLIQPFLVEGSSMAPRFHSNDYLVVDKISYRLHTPNRGDIVVFKYPLDTTVNYIKRVIGLPGETVRIQNGKVYVINSEHPNGFELKETYLGSGIKTDVESNALKAEFIVPKDQYFVLGDNRPASSDSREWGFLPMSDITGKVLFQAYPLNEIQFTHSVTY